MRKPAAVASGEAGPVHNNTSFIAVVRLPVVVASVPDAENTLVRAAVPFCEQVSVVLLVAAVISFTLVFAAEKLAGSCPTTSIANRTWFAVRVPGVKP
jgi:hypothetical protein